MASRRQFLGWLGAAVAALPLARVSLAPEPTGSGRWVVLNEEVLGDGTTRLTFVFTQDPEPPPVTWAKEFRRG